MRLLLALLFAVALVPCLSVVALAQAKEAGLPLLFSSRRDLVEPWGMLHIAVTPVAKLAEVAPPPFTYVAGFPGPDGAWEVYGQEFTEVKRADRAWEQVNSWRLVRATTTDGVTFSGREVVYEAPPGAWTSHIALARNGRTGERLMLKLKIDSSGFATTAFFSRDGRTWEAHPGNPLFYDGDSMSLFWSEALGRFVCVNKSLQPYRKRLVDHGGATPALKDDTLRDRRVLMMRTSVDGRTWEPNASLPDVWDQHGKKGALPARYLTVPDEQDPPDLEFYSGNAFWYRDRAYMLVLNYAASAAAPRKHAPQLDNEWWTSPDGLHWERPARGINALEVFPTIPRLETPPMAIGGRLLFPRGTLLLGLPEDRITGAAARANAEFATRWFRMPAGGLLLNAAVPSPDRPFGKEQAYVMVELQDETGHTIPGFEAEKCLIKAEDSAAIRLKWTGADAAKPAGKRVRLRFHLRSATVYAVTGAG